MVAVGGPDFPHAISPSMAVRTCIHCGYELTGLARHEYLILCPECGLANDLRAPFWLRVSTVKPYLWGMAPVAFGTAVIWAASALRVPHRSLDTVVQLVVLLTPLTGATIAAVRMGEMVSREASLSGPVRPGWQRLLLMACAGTSVLIINVVLTVVLMSVIFWR